MMRQFDLSPLFRTSVGFDRLNQLFDTAMRAEDTPAYPPYNIEKTGEDTYRITMAVAGFGEDDLDVQAKDNTLTVSGKLADAEAEGSYLHRGIAGRAFQRSFQLADHIKVSGADLSHGLLHVELVREVPEEMKPRKIAIGTNKGWQKVLGGKTAA